MKKYKYIVKNLDCPSCASKIQDRLQKEEDLKNISLNYGTMKLTYETDKTTIEKVTKISKEIEPEIEFILEDLKKYEFYLDGLDCADCARKIEEEISKIDGIENVIVNFSTLRLTYQTVDVSKEEVIEKIKSIEPEVNMIEKTQKTDKKKNDNGILFKIIRIIFGFLIACIGFKTNTEILIIIGYLVLLYRTMKNAFKLLIKSKTINENLLVTISCIGAYLVGEHMEGLLVIILYEIGKTLEDVAVGKSRKSIKDLMDIKPEYANLKLGSDNKKVNPSEVKIGDIVVIKQGEKIPLDGIVVKGECSLNTASLTGESRPIKVKKESKVLSGSINEDGIIEIRVTEEYKNSTVSKILELVENATDKKAKTETFVNKAAKIYTPIVLGLAAILWITLPMISNGAIPYGTKEGSIYRALIFLVVSCPCAIAISVPLSYFSGIGKASKEGILIKGSDYIDAIKDIKEIAFDKTGTLTKGEFGVEKIETYSNISEAKILEYAVLGESFSNHPIAISIIKSSNIIVNTANVKKYKEVAGQGILYELNGDAIAIGNYKLVGEEKENDEYTKIYVKINNNLAGAIYLSDIVKDNAKPALNKLKEQGIKCLMFTGDNEKVAEEVAKKVGIDYVKANLLPQDKYNELENEISKYKEKNGKVAFVGDGINDSPVLARADVGISMGGLGSQSAIEASDIVIMTDDINKISEGIKISKKTCRIIKQNLIFAIITKIIVLILSSFGIVGMLVAVFADVGVTLITIFNTLRILK